MSPGRETFPKGAQGRREKRGKGGMRGLGTTRISWDTNQRPTAIFCRVRQWLRVSVSFSVIYYDLVIGFIKMKSLHPTSEPNLWRTPHV